MELTPQTQYATDANLRARQRLWDVSVSEPEFVLHPWVVDLANLEGGERILEVGCGNGAYLATLDAVGMDVSLGMLAAARPRATGPLLCGDVQRLPLREASFDVVLAPHMLYHVDDRQLAARELRRVLEPGGTCVAVTNGDANDLEIVRLVEAAVGRGWRFHRPASTAFSLENGADQLRAGFANVRRIDCPPRVVSVRDADALADYVASIGDHYVGEIADWMSWREVVDRCRRRVADIIEAEGAFRISKSMGAFVCD